jgi:hypothetical protein
VVFRFGRLLAAREPGFRLIIPLVDVLHRVSLRVVTMPIQSQGIITKLVSKQDRLEPHETTRARECSNEPPDASLTDNAD